MRPPARLLPRRPVLGSAPGQVSWLSDRPTPRAFPTRLGQWHLRVSSPITVTGSRRLGPPSLRPSRPSRTQRTSRTLTKSRSHRNHTELPRSAVRDALEGPDAAGEVHQNLLRPVRALPPGPPEAPAA